MTQLEKLRFIAQKVKDNINSYEPSYHVYVFYYDNKVSDLPGYIIKFKEAVSLTCDFILQAEVEDHEFNDINPVPLFYVNEESLTECFSVIENQTVVLLRTAILANRLLEIVQTQEGNES